MAKCKAKIRDELGGFRNLIHKLSFKDQKTNDLLAVLLVMSEKHQAAILHTMPKSVNDKYTALLSPFFICGPDNLSLFYVCADYSGHLHHVNRLALFQVCKVSDFARFAF